MKATGYQWYWGYEYPDQKISEIVSAAAHQGAGRRQEGPVPAGRRLKAMVVPVNQVVRVQVTGADVIPRLRPAGVRPEMVSGYPRAAWMEREPGFEEPRRPGSLLRPVPSELCGVDHSNMPIEIHVVSQAQFEARGLRRRSPCRLPTPRRPPRPPP
ncbi:hypothetical protein ACRAWD_12630 [Caulobacter segnis]